MRYFVAYLLIFILMLGAFDADTSKITPWLLGINFMLAIFSINFTFFGYQLSKYSSLYNEISSDQWWNISVLMVLPFIPLLFLMYYPAGFGVTALLFLPLLMFSAIDNALITKDYLDPKSYIIRIVDDENISKYLSSLSQEIIIEVDEYEVNSKELQNFQRSLHGSEYHPTLLGVQPNDLWDEISLVTQLSIKNSDYPIFRKSIEGIFTLIVASYSFKHEVDDRYQVHNGIKEITRKRFRAIFAQIADGDPEGLFLQSLSNEICEFIKSPDVIHHPNSSLARSMAKDVVWIGKMMLESRSDLVPINNLNSLQEVIETNLHNWNTDKQDTVNRSVDEHNICVYAYDIESLGQAAINNNDPHFAYRCMESLSYLGCNAAKIKSQQTIVAVFESLVQLGRSARMSKIGCFSSRCLIPMESHAEELIGHILTWLIKDLDKEGNFFMKEHAEQSYSRLRGYKCLITPRPDRNPSCWIDEMKKDGKTIPHIETESGMFGYEGNCDYSDFSNLKEYTLYGISPANNNILIRSSPMPLEIMPIDDE